MKGKIFCTQHTEIFSYFPRKQVLTFNTHCLQFCMKCQTLVSSKIVLGFNDMLILEDLFVSSPRERERRDSRDDESDGRGRKRSRNEREETEEIKTFTSFKKC